MNSSRKPEFSGIINNINTGTPGKLLKIWKSTSLQKVQTKSAK